MYEIYEQLLQKHGVTSYKVSKDTGIAQSILSAWKKGVSTPKQDKLKLIADYFGVSVNYLMTGEENDASESDFLMKDSNEKDLILHFRNADLTEDQKSALAKMLCSNIDTFLEYANSKKENK